MRATLPRRTDSADAIRNLAADRRAEIGNQLFRSGDIARALGLEPMSPLVQDTITDIITSYSVTRPFTTTIGQALRLLAVLHRLLKALIVGAPLRRRDIERRVEFLQRLVDSERGTDQQTFDMLSPTTVNLTSELKARRSCSALALELDGLAAAEATRLRTLLNEGRKVQGNIEQKRHLCGLLRLVWEQFSAPLLRGPKANRRNFVSAVLTAAGIDHPHGNDYQTLDDWIKTDVSIPLQPVFAPTGG